MLAKSLLTNNSQIMLYTRKQADSFKNEVLWLSENVINAYCIHPTTGEMRMLYYHT